LEKILEEGEPPTGDNRDPKRRTLKLQMTIPGQVHEEVGNREQENGFH
jgi:hypothetical protein